MNLIESIRIFRRVVETKSFTVVARELGVGQPTVSKLVRGLERELEVSLLHRSTRGVSLTPAGTQLYRSSEALLDHFDTVITGVHDQKRGLNGELRIAASLVFARVVLVPLLAEFEALHPELRLSFHLSDGFVDLIEKGIDVAIRIGELPDSTLKATKLGGFGRAIYASREYLKRHGRPREIEDLRNHRLLFYSRLREGPSWSLRDGKGTAKKFRFEPFLRTDGSDLMREAVLKGLGIAMFPTWLMAEAERDGLVERIFDVADRPANVYAVTPNARTMTAKQDALVSFLSARLVAQASARKT